ncbi:transporter substrate-binding domain-containing protein [Bartonella sp. DGB1]|uniref:transporter substrate-binding domain-containing protein n=1 Tax=Bartonella sp. DGB1 TaxID=3239807 RepID=UPI003525F6AE
MNKVQKIINLLFAKVIFISAICISYGFVKFIDNFDYILRPDLSEHKELLFITSNDFPPFNYINDNGDLVGYHLELVRLICKELDVIDRCVIKAVPWNNLLSEISKGKAKAVVAGVVNNGETRKIIDFSEEYLRFPARFLANKEMIDSNFRVTNESLQQLTIGVVANSKQAKLAKSYFATSDINLYPNDNSLLAALYAGRISLALGDGFKFSQWLKLTHINKCCKFIGGNYWAPQILNPGLSIGIKKGDKKLLYAINFALFSLEQKGKLEELYLQYFPIAFIE